MNMKIKLRTGISRQRKSWLKYMGLLPPKKKGRLKQLTKHNRPSRHRPSEAILMFRKLEEKNHE